MPQESESFCRGNEGVKGTRMVEKTGLLDFILLDLHLGWVPLKMISRYTYVDQSPGCGRQQSI
jgi:hypothetical protein